MSTTPAIAPASPARRSRRRLALTAVVVTGLLFTAACGDDDDEPSASDTTETTAAEETTTESTPEAAEVVDGVLTVQASDYSFGELPESVPAGTQVDLNNTSSIEFHEMIVFRIPDEETRSAEELAHLSEEEQAAIFTGPPAAVILAGPDGAASIPAVGDGTLADAGRYLLMCFIPTGADPEAYAEAAQNPEAGPPETTPDSGAPHVAHGMFAELVVE